VRTGEHPAAAVLLADARELVVIVEEELEPAVGDVHAQVGAELPVLLHRGPAA